MPRHSLKLAQQTILVFHSVGRVEIDFAIVVRLGDVSRDIGIALELPDPV